MEEQLDQIHAALKYINDELGCVKVRLNNMERSTKRITWMTVAIILMVGFQILRG